MHVIEVEVMSKRTVLAVFLFHLSGLCFAQPPGDPQALVEEAWLHELKTHGAGGPVNITTSSDAGGAVDGVKNGRWGFCTSQEDRPWWQVDLGTLQGLSRVLIFNPYIPNRASRLAVLLSDDGTTWRKAYAHANGPPHGATGKDPLTVPLKDAKARYLRIQLEERQYLHFDEVEVFGTAEPEMNLALKRPADQSSVSQWSTDTAPAPVSVTYPMITEVIQRGRRLAARLKKEGVDVARFEKELDDTAGLVDAELADASEPRRKALYLKARHAVRALALSDPLLDCNALIFVKRFTFHSSHIYTDYYDGSSRLGGNLCVLSPVALDGTARDIVPELDGGIFGRFDLSFDAKSVVFSYKKPGKGYRIYEVGVDGKGLRQLTHDGPDEAQMTKRYGHGYDDMDPCYLPDGRIMFASTRSKRAVLCTRRFTSTALHVMDADGGHMRCVSGNTSNEFTPAMMPDGRVLYTRWEYVDKGCGDVQSLWSMFPDGSHSAHVYKNNVRRPATLIDGRCIPGSHRIVATGAPHMPLAVGPVVLIDTHITQLTPAAMSDLTPEIAYPGHFGYPGARCGHYKEPYPLSERLFLVAYNPSANHAEPTGYGLYLLDDEANRELIYRDPEISCFQPMPLRRRPVPPVLTPASDIASDIVTEEGLATLFMLDVYQGLTGIERGRVKYLRVMEDVPKPWEPSWVSRGQGDSLGLQNPAISLRGHFAIRRILGVVPVHEDGSAHFMVPPDVNLYFQVLDENYMELQRMRTFVNLMPGENRSCIGCHESRKSAPSLRRPLAMALPPKRLRPQPGDTGPRVVHYPTDVQPILDKHCISCHGAKEPKGDLDLTGAMTTLFSRSYENLLNRRLINNINVDPRDAYIPAEPPLRFGSHLSKLVKRIDKDPCAAGLTKIERIRIVTWIDANAPFYGVYEGKKNLKWKDDPEFRPEPKAVAASLPAQTALESTLQ
jgi:hypothetical protein